MFSILSLTCYSSSTLPPLVIQILLPVPRSYCHQEVSEQQWIVFQRHQYFWNLPLESLLKVKHLLAGNCCLKCRPLKCGLPSAIFQVASHNMSFCTFGSRDNISDSFICYLRLLADLWDSCFNCKPVENINGKVFPCANFGVCFIFEIGGL